MPFSRKLVVSIPYNIHDLSLGWLSGSCQALETVASRGAWGAVFLGYSAYGPGLRLGFQGTLQGFHQGFPGLSRLSGWGVGFGDGNREVGEYESDPPCWFCFS